MMWSFFRDRYCGTRDAVERADPNMLSDPRIAHALTQIAAMDLLVDSVMEAHLQGDGDD